MATSFNVADMSNDDFLQLLNYTNSTPPNDTGKDTPRQDYLGYAGFPSFSMNNTPPYEFPPTPTSSTPRKTPTEKQQVAQIREFTENAYLNSRNILASLDRIEAIIEWIHDSQNRQDARLAKLEEKIEEVKEEVAEVVQTLRDQELNCSHCNGEEEYSGDDQSDDASDDDVSETDYNSEGVERNDSEVQEFYNMYGPY
ncbi:uncharacterized protein ColSpa_08688 [Colletotrichum spaethianum]|uniref:Uncharacterized protein n=1 Tax=Colletotrichum spaethianum TaxID=700344 RepID=A0AA37PA88_9PEZI|nr:uncharacterized protein ColSpa_08688 [Colletotrichum spaethianum]GKT48507.1 hypothetical protein ColSpa_08688 [Colletotrichum spaethianum]